MLKVVYTTSRVLDMRLLLLVALLAGLTNKIDGKTRNNNKYFSYNCESIS